MEKEIVFGNCNGLMNVLSEKGILFFNGFFADKDESKGLFKTYARQLNKEGFSTLRYDPTGLGKSNKGMENITINDWIEDSRKAINLFGNYTNKIGIVGFSLGAAYAVLQSNKPKVNCLALWAPALNPRLDMLNRYKRNGDYEKSKNGLLTKSKKKVFPYMLDSLDFDVLNKLENIECPVLICHSRNDPYIPLSTSDSIKNKISNLDELLVIENAGHSFRQEKQNKSSVRTQVYNRTTDFFRKNLD